MKKRKVAILDNSVDVTGALNAILEYTEYARKEYDFIFVLPRKSKATQLVQTKGFIVFELSFLEISKSWKSWLWYFPQLFINGYKLRNITIREKVDILHINDFFNMTGGVARLLGGSFKLITHVRFMPDRFPSLILSGWMNFNLKFAEAIVCVSCAVKKHLPDHSKIRVIYDCFPGKLLKMPTKSNLDGQVNFLYLGHYIKGKGQDLALEAFFKAYCENPDLRLKFVGGDMGLRKNKEFKAQLETRVKELRLEKVVELASATNNVSEEMAFTDVSLNFSESESFSMTCLEALGMGVPLIATDCGGPAELFEHEKSGLLVPNKNIEAMAGAILQLAEDPERRWKFSRNSIIYVREKFSANVTSRKLCLLYKEVLNDF